MLITVNELQQLLHIGRDKAYALMHSKAFPSIKLGGRYYVSKDELDSWLKKYAYREFNLTVK